MKRGFLFPLFVLIMGMGNRNDGPGNSGCGRSDTTKLKLGVPQIKRLPVVYREEYLAGNVRPGDHTQHMLDLSYSESDPDRIYMAQDVSSIWVSRDFGLNWFVPANQGLYTPFIISVEADPLNKNRVLAAVQCRMYDGANEEEQGIYQSLDGGITWLKRMARTQLGEVRSSTKLITYAPTSKNKKLGYAERWYAAFSEYKKTEHGDELVADDGLVYSDDGGQSWAEVRKLPTDDFGSRIRGIKVHATNQEKVFMFGNGGLFCFEDATNASGAVTRLSGRGGLPAGDIWGQLYQSENGSVLIVAVSGKGVYKSVTGGATWNLLYAWDNVNYCFVNKRFPDKIFAVPTERSKKQIRISDDGGKTWHSPSMEDVVYRAGYEKSYWNNMLNGQFTYLLPDPRDVNNVFIHTKSKNFRSADGGKTWSVSDYGYNGASQNGSEQMFDPANPDRFCYFMTDRGVVTTTNRGRWFTNGNMVPSEFGLSWKSCVAGALQPGGPGILACVGSGSNGKLMRSPDNGNTWTVASDGEKTRWVIAYDLQDSRYCYQWRERSDDTGKTWKELPDMPAKTIICGVSPSDGNVLYAMDINGTSRKIWKSVDRGDTWGSGPAITTSWDLTFPGPSKQFTFSVDPANAHIVYTSSADGQITRWDLSGSVARPVPITFPGSEEHNFFIKNFAIDPRHPDIMYAINQRASTGHKFFRSSDGGLNWQNISGYVPQGTLKGLSVSPVTGEVYVSSQNGSMVMLPPYTTSNTAYELAPYALNLLTEPYD